MCIKLMPAAAQLLPSGYRLLASLPSCPAHHNQQDLHRTAIPLLVAMLTGEGPCRGGGAR